ncbi:MAG TPA: DUF2007 domain-containing protein [Syntrophales bacterium]|nr:DUF2007 domain-containing protein [Syntrophales bacterium]HPQ44272.1 DUF2007 domain-containing protein [Syntrophales bacterium]
MEDEKWEVVHVSSGMIDANIVAGRLETEGIPVKFGYEAVGVIYALTLDGLGAVRILVPTEYLKRAREVLAESYEELLEESFDDVADS